MEKFEFGDKLVYTSPQNSDLKTLCIFLRDDNGKAVVMFSHAECAQFFTEAEDGLKQPWGGQTVFCNPPYGRAIKDWVKKCSEEAKQPNTTVVLLIPARTDTAYFHDYIYLQPNVEIRFIRGRLKFGDGKNSAPFPSMVVIFR